MTETAREITGLPHVLMDVACRAESLREELPAAMAQLPPAGDQEGQHLRRRRGSHPQAPPAPRQQVHISAVSFHLYPRENLIN